MSNWANEMTLKADKGRTSEQRAQFKQQVIQTIEADRLMQAQQVESFIVGVAAHSLTRLR
jgi:hypothetical protein